MLIQREVSALTMRQIAKQQNHIQLSGEKHLSKLVKKFIRLWSISLSNWIISANKCKYTTSAVPWAAEANDPTITSTQSSLSAQANSREKGTAACGGSISLLLQPLRHPPRRPPLCSAPVRWRRFRWLRHLRHWC